MNEKPLFEERQLFEPGEGGYPVFRIPGIVATGKGTLVAYAEARSTTSDWAKMDLVMKRSEDGGQTWGALQVLVRNAPSESTTYNNPYMIAEKGRNVVHFLYCKNYHEVFYMKSENGGKDWTEPVNLTDSTIAKFRAEGQQPRPYQWKVVAAGPGHGIELRNGRLLAPVWLANGPTDRNHGPSVVTTIYSDDKGATWKTGEILYDSAQVKSPGEPTAVELQDGSVMMNIRSGLKMRSVSVSPDGISRWTPMKPDEVLVDPSNFAGIARYSFREENGHNRILFTNANDAAHRRNITLRMSEDDGKTWTYSRVVQPGQGAYSDVNVAPDKTIHLLYEQGVGIKAVRLNAAWLMSGEELENLSFDTGELTPSFRSGVHEFTLDVREELTSITVTPKLPAHSGALVKINGQMLSAGGDLKVSLQSGAETKLRLTVESPKGEVRSEYNVTVRKSLPKGTMVGYWNFDQVGEDGKVTDQGEMHNDGTAKGVTAVPGKAGGALQFGGGYVDIADGKGFAFGTGDFTAALWAKADRLDEFMTLLWYGDVGATANGWYVRTQEHDKLFFRTGGGTGETLMGTSKAVLTPGKWTHIAAEKKGNVMKLYIDGQEVQTKVTTLNFDVNGKSNALRIGKPKTGETRYWAGAIDEVRLYNYALSDAEIKQLYESAKGTGQ
ncbi:LamG-like jellyroll fold domain-containing protein [Paenibacillus solanacearum]|nr:LamG-like jellyroll fold domain-containing protein [Paenibacillus solanacearum]